MKTVQVTLTGISPMMMHADTLVDPLNPKAIAHKKLTSDRKLKATHEGQVLIAESLFMNSFYLNSSNKIILPMLNIRKSLIEGARRFKLGKDIERSMNFYEDPELQYPSKQTPAKMWSDYGQHVDARSVVIGRAKVMAYRPLFNEWSVTFQCQFDPEVINLDSLRECWDSAGTMACIGDFRPLFGKYRAEVVEA